MEAVRPEGFERLSPNTGLINNCKQGGTKSGTNVQDSSLGQVLQALASLTDDERELLNNLLRKMD